MLNLKRGPLSCTNFMWDPREILLVVQIVCWAQERAPQLYKFYFGPKRGLLNCTKFDAGPKRAPLSCTSSMLDPREGPLVVQIVCWAQEVAPQLYTFYVGPKREPLSCTTFYAGPKIAPLSCTNVMLGAVRLHFSKSKTILFFEGSCFCTLSNATTTTPQTHFFRSYSGVSGLVQIGALQPYSRPKG